MSVTQIFEPPHDKSNKMTVHPAKSQISLGIRPIWSESLLCAQWVAKDPSFLHADSKDWPDWGVAQADLSLRWAHMPFCWFCHDAAHFFFGFTCTCLAASIFPRSISREPEVSRALTLSGSISRARWQNFWANSYSNLSIYSSAWKIRHEMSEEERDSKDILEPQHDKTNKITGVPSKDSDQPAHLCALN